MRYHLLLLNLPLVLAVGGGQAQWAPTNGPYFYNGTTMFRTSVYSLAVNAAYIFAGAVDSVYRTDDGGASWTALRSGLPPRVPSVPPLEVSALMVNGAFVFAGAWMSGYTGSVFRSSDNGGTWMAADSGLPSQVEVYSLAARDSYLFAGSGDGVFRSADSGRRWMAANSGLSGGIGAYVGSFAVKGPYVFAAIPVAIQNGVFRTSNDGAGWGAANSGLTSRRVRSLAVMGSYLFVGADSGRVFRSSDDGATWVTVDSGIAVSANRFVNCLLAAGPALFAGTSSSGVFLSLDYGASWFQVNDGLASLYIYSLAVKDGFLYAGASTGGVWRRPLAEMIPSVSLLSPRFSYKISEAASGSILTIHILGAGRYAVSAMDLGGKKVFASTAIGPGKLEIPGLKRGVYVVSIASSRSSQLRKVIVP